MVGVLSRDSGPLAPWNRHWPVLLPAVGRRLRWRWGRGPVSFTLRSLSVVPSLPGRLRSVRLEVGEVEIDRVRLGTVRIAATDVRLRSTSLVAGHVELEVKLSQQGLDDLVGPGMPYAAVRLDGEVGRASLASRPDWAHVELTPEVRDGSLLLMPVAVVTGHGRRWAAPARLLPRLRIGSEVLLPGSRLTRVAVRDSTLHLDATMSDVEVPLIARRGEAVADLSEVRPA